MPAHVKVHSIITESITKRCKKERHSQRQEQLLLHGQLQTFLHTFIQVDLDQLFVNGFDKQ